MQRALAAALKDDKNRPDATQIEMVRSLASELEEIEAVGRITIQADPAVLTVKPEQNMLLEHGDRLYIPKRPLNVRVSGEVLSPSSLQFIEEKNPRDYIYEAGGFTFHADKNRTFVLYPNGRAQPL
jgi:protein involved in polysaccharide export with SLBB domain